MTSTQAVVSFDNDYLSHCNALFSVTYELQSLLLNDIIISVTNSRNLNFFILLCYLSRKIQIIVEWKRKRERRAPFEM